MKIEPNNIYQGDCLELMKYIPDKSIDMILCDLPYGTTACKWDTIIPFEPLWEQYKRIIKDNGAIVLFGGQPFTSALIMSNLPMYKYSLVWRKTRIQGFAQAPYRFMTEHEDIIIFAKGGCAKNAKIRMNFHPQGLVYNPRITKGKKANASQHRIRKTDQKEFLSEWTNYPKSVIEIGSEFKTIHPTQKPVELCEYLIKTYTNEGDTVLDNCMGSGSTIVACINTNRKYIGIEKELKYFEIAKKRIESVMAVQMELKGGMNYGN